MIEQSKWCDYPAAHSADSGWFAVDRTGALAHFDTGEAGAMPVAAIYTTGESESAEMIQFWVQEAAPWIARNSGGKRWPYAAYALFDSAEFAAAAAAADGGTVCEDNPQLVELAYGEETSIDQRDGFVGFAPTILDAERELLPIAWYACDDYDVPGAYVRQAPPGEVAGLRLPSDLEVMDVEFAEASQLNLADFYRNDECVSWSEGDLRTGELPARDAHDEANRRPSFLDWLKRFFGR